MQSKLFKSQRKCKQIMLTNLKLRLDTYRLYDKQNIPKVAKTKDKSTQYIFRGQTPIDYAENVISIYAYFNS